MSSAERILLLSIAALVVWTYCTFVNKKRVCNASNLARLPVTAKYVALCGAILGVASWWGLPPDLSKHHLWDLFHYYTGTKYFEQLEYTGLYDCALRVDRESDVPTHFPSTSVRSLESNSFVSLDDALTQSQVCRERFTDEQWKAFSRDVLWFRSEMGERWKTIFHDHGFNPSPWWIWISKWLIPSSSVNAETISYLVKIDIAVLGCMWIVVFLTWDIRIAALAAIVWGTNPLANGSWTAGGLLRHDWIAAVVFGLAALRTSRDTLAGILLSYAASVRVFPVILLIGAALFRGGKSTSKCKPEVLRTMCGALLGGFLVAGLTIGTFGVSAWTQFASNTAKHVATRGGNLVGLGHVVDHVVQCRFVAATTTEGVCTPPERIDASPLGWVPKLITGVCALLFLGWLSWWSRTVALWECVAASALVLPLVTSPSSYYYELFILPLFLAARSPYVGSVMIGMSVILQLVSLSVSPPNKVYLVASVVVLQVVVMVPLLLIPNRRGRDSS